MRSLLQREMRDFWNDPPEGCIAEYDDDNIYIWCVYIIGPPESPYEGGIFILTIYFPHDYPFKIPHIKFETPIYHLNIPFSQNFSVDKFYEYLAGASVKTILASFRALLSEPNADCPNDPEIGEIFINDREKYNQIAREWCQEHTMQK